MDLNNAINIAIEAHKGDPDKVGKPYITHVLRVMERCKTEEEKMVAALHDVVEDHKKDGWTFHRLESEGFSKTVIDAVRAISQDENESKTDYIERLIKNPLAIRVKLNDLEDNMDIRRLPELTEKDITRLKNYLKTYHRLLKVVSSEER